MGLIPLYDPPREDSKQVIADMQAHGVEVKMVTGDNMAIAREIGGLLGLEQRTMRSDQLSGTAGNELLALASVLAAAIYQRLKPEVSRKEAQQFADEVMETVGTMYDTRLLEREFLHTHESAIVEMIESVNIFAEVVPGGQVPHRRHPAEGRPHRRHDRRRGERRAGLEEGRLRHRGLQRHRRGAGGGGHHPHGAGPRRSSTRR